MGIYDERALIDANTPIIPQLTVFLRLSSEEVLEKKTFIKIRYLDNDILTDHENFQPIAANNKYINMAFNISPVRVTGKDEIQVFLCERDTKSETLIASLPIEAEKSEQNSK